MVKLVVAMDRGGSTDRRHQQIAGCDIIKRGTLYVKHPPSSFLPQALSIQAWKRRYVVLKDTWYCIPRVVTSSLDIYDSEPPSLQTQPDHLDCRARDGASRSFSAVSGRHEPYSLNLRHVTAVGFHLDSRRFQCAFYVERSDARPLLFAAHSDFEMRCWVAALRMLADKSRLGASPSPDSTRSVSTSSSTRRRTTLPSTDDVNVCSVPPALTLDRRRRNLSDPQLHAVPPAAVRRYAFQSSVRTSAGRTHVSLQRKLTAPDISNFHRSHTSAMLSLNEVDSLSLVSADSLVGAAAADDDDDGEDRRHPLRRIFSSLLHRDIDGRRRTLSKLRRKDSGFSESFDDDSCEDRGHVEPERDSSYSSSSSMGNSPPPTPPPRPPPRRTTTTAGDEPPPTTLRQPPPPPSVTREHDQRPPTPPPRPPHTLLGSISLH